jgi:hypothetical protein
MLVPLTDPAMLAFKKQGELAKEMVPLKLASAAPVFGPSVILPDTPSELPLNELSEPWKVPLSGLTRFAVKVPASPFVQPPSGVAYVPLIVVPFVTVPVIAVAWPFSFKTNLTVCPLTVPVIGPVTAHGLLNSSKFPEIELPD